MKTSVFLAAAFWTLGVTAQNETKKEMVFPQKSFFVGASGFNYQARDLGGYGLNGVKVESFYGTGLSPIYLKYEHRTAKKSLGCNVAYTTGTVTARVKDTNDLSGKTYFEDKIKKSSASVLFRMNRYFNTKKLFQPYLGFGVGLRSVKYTDYSPNYNPVRLKNKYTLGFETTLGAKLNITGYLFAYAEFGLAKSIGQIGLVYTLKNK